MLPELATADTYDLTPAGAAALLRAHARAAAAWRDLVAWNLDAARAQPCGLLEEWRAAERALAALLEA